MLKLLFFKKPHLTQAEIEEQFKQHVYLFGAINRNSIPKAIKCLQNGANPNKAVLNSIQGTTLLQHAIHVLKDREYANSADPDCRIIELLLSEGASAKLLDKNKRDAFFYASPSYETQGIDPKRAQTTSEKLNVLLRKKYPQITEKNIKKISKILTNTTNSSLNKLCPEVLKNIVSFLFTDPDKTKVFLNQLATSVTRPKPTFKFYPSF